MSHIQLKLVIWSNTEFPYYSVFIIISAVIVISWYEGDIVVLHETKVKPRSSVITIISSEHIGYNWLMC